MTRLEVMRALDFAGEFIRFEEDPVLASLCTCFGLQFEMGKRDFDRLSPFFGMEVENDGSQPWESQILQRDALFGLQLSRKDGQPLTVRHRDFCYILDRTSFDSEGNLASITIFPSQVAQTFRARGFELVIVKDWIKTTAFTEESNSSVPYLFANQWEIENNIALTQAKLLSQSQLAFSGTHDIVDHLLGSNIEKFQTCLPMVNNVLDTYEAVFDDRIKIAPSSLILSYLIGILLDDLAQPKWYGSPSHLATLQWALEILQDQEEIDHPSVTLPHAFHALVQAVRSRHWVS